MKIYYEGQEKTGFDIFDRICPICGGNLECGLSYKVGYGTFDIFTCDNCSFSAVLNKELANFLVDYGSFSGAIEL